MDERLRELERACTADPGPLNQDRLYAERARLGRPVPPRLAGSWVEDEIARGGWFSVHRVLHRESATYQALSLHPLPLLDGPRRRRLERRAELDHPAFPALYELGEATWAGHPVFYAREELVQGETLEQRRDLDWRAVCRLVTPLCSALQALHAAGLVHANLSPDNLHLTPGGKVHLVGWSRLHRFAPEPDPPARAPGLSAVERYPAVPYFEAPEQLRFETPTPATDVYALCASLHFALTGRRPFVGTLQEVFRQIASAPPPDLHAHAPGVPAELANLIRGGLAKAPSQRPSLAQLARASAALLDPAEGGLLRRAWRALGGSS